MLSNSSALVCYPFTKFNLIWKRQYWMSQWMVNTVHTNNSMCIEYACIPILTMFNRHSFPVCLPVNQSFFKSWPQYWHVKQNLLPVRQRERERKKATKENLIKTRSTFVCISNLNTNWCRKSSSNGIFGFVQWSMVLCCCYSQSNLRCLHTRLRCMISW